MIQIQNLGKAFRQATPLDGFSHIFPQEGVVALMGPSGCGKTTLLRLLAGLEKPDTGTISGCENARISMVFQEDRLIEALTVADNVQLVQKKESGRFEKAAELLRALGLGEALHQYPSQLSGGMKRRCAIARALAYNGDIFLLDEPLKGLDDQLKDQTMALIKEKTKGKLTLLVTHDGDEAAAMATQILRFTGPPMTLGASPLS